MADSAVVTPTSLAERLASGEPPAAGAIAPVTFVIVGGGGDLAHRKLLPALYNLHVDGLLPARIAIVGVGRKAMSDEAYREFAKDGVTRFSRRTIDDAEWRGFAAGLFFVAAEIDGE